MWIKFDLKRIATVSLGTTLGLFLVSATSFAQTQSAQNRQAGTGPLASEISTTYKEARKDPFFAYEAKIVIPTPGPVIERKVEVIPPPSFEERDALWKQKRADAIKFQQISPSPSEKYLIDEVKVLGLYKKPEGQGVFLKPTPTASTTIFAMVGQRFWNGEIKKIDKDKIEVEVKSQLTNGKLKTEIQTIPFTRGK